MPELRIIDFRDLNFFFYDLIFVNMNTESFIKKYFAINKAIYDGAMNPLRSHGPDHHMRVLRNALKLAKGRDADLEILIPACLLHDISAYFPEEVGDNYHDEDPKRAEKILHKNVFPKEKIDVVVDAIANHGSAGEFKTKRISEESKILCDADKLDVFGPIGVARIIMVKTLRGGTLNDVVEDFYAKGHLLRKWNGMSNRAKKIGKKDFEYSMQFLKSLAKKLEAK